MRLHQKLVTFFILVATCAAATAQTGLLLSGEALGFFQPSAEANAVITNSADGWAASFRTGVPQSGSFQSGVKFNGHAFENVGNGDTFSLGLFTYYNGIARLGTSSGSALLDFSINFTGQDTGPVHLTTFNFGIVATPNTPGGLVPDTFSASFTQPAPIRLGDKWVKFTINGPPAFYQMAENTVLDFGSVSVSYFDAIPEPATNALILGVVALGLVIFFRRRNGTVASVFGLGAAVS